VAAGFLHIPAIILARYASIASTDHESPVLHLPAALHLTLAARFFPALHHKGPQWAPSPPNGFPPSINFSHSPSTEPQTPPEAPPRSSRSARPSKWAPGSIESV